MSNSPVWLYVPRDEVPQALAFGASFRAGDARMVMPQPIPAGLTERHFARWRGKSAAASWMREQIVMTADAIDDRPADHTPRDLAGSEFARDRVYLWVRRSEAEQISQVEGVRWDKRRRMFYATRETDLNAVFRHMTPEACLEWESEQATMRLVDQTVRDQAIAELDRYGAGGGGRRNHHGRGEMDERTD